MTFRVLPGMLCAAGLMLSSCAVTHVEPPRRSTPPEAFRETGLWQRASAAETVPVPDRWWTLFKDRLLDELQAQLIIGNETLKASVARIAAARATLEASRSGQLPTLAAVLAAGRSETPGVAAGAKNPANSVTLTGSASWELDLWGRLSQAVSGAEATFQASAHDLAAARLSTQALLAQTYFSLRAAEAQLLLLERSTAAYERALALTHARYDSGVAARIDVLQAQTQLNTARAQIAEVSAQRAVFEHAIAVLLGLPPSSIAIERSASLPSVPAVPEMLPSTLLQRRPDIVAAQRRVAAAYAQIGVADAAFFPALTLSAGLGYRNSAIADLVRAPNLFWSLGSSLAQPIFDGGQRQFASAQARAAADLATATYRQTVLTALQEVEDNLVLADQLGREAGYQAQAVQAAQHSLEIVLDQYRAGTVSYFNVTITQNAALSTESSLLSTRNRQLAATNLLLKNIAGSWDAR